MKISIVTAYYNRKSQFINTLKVISKSEQINDLELIVVDDCSSEEHRLEGLIEEFPFMRIIRLESKDRWYTNPCVPFNIAINDAIGDIIVLQNPECLHIGDILDDIVNSVTEINYVTYGVYSTTKEMVDEVSLLNFKSPGLNDELIDIISPMHNVNYVAEGKSCWYNHSIYRPAGYHFIAAITKNNMNKLNGFDERYSNGIGFDDDEFLFRVKLLGLDVEIHDTPFAIHQWHYSENNFFDKSENVGLALQKNQQLFNNITKNLKSPYVS